MGASESKIDEYGYHKIWNEDNKFSYGKLTGVPIVSQYNVHCGLDESKYLKVNVEGNILYFLLNPDDNPRLVIDENEELRSLLGIKAPPSMVIPTGITSNTCISLQKNIKFYNGMDSLIIKFIKNEKYCDLLKQTDCRVMDVVIGKIFCLLKLDNFNGVVQLNDDMKKDGDSVFMWRLINNRKPYSKYMEYGFNVSEENKEVYYNLVKLVEEERDTDSLDSDKKTLYTNTFQRLLKNMINTNYIKTFKEIIEPRLRVCYLEK